MIKITVPNRILVKNVFHSDLNPVASFPYNPFFIILINTAQTPEITGKKPNQPRGLSIKISGYFIEKDTNKTTNKEINKGLKEIALLTGVLAELKGLGGEFQIHSRLEYILVRASLIDAIKLLISKRGKGKIAISTLGPL